MPFFPNLLKKAKSLFFTIIGFFKNLPLKGKLIYIGFGFAFLFLLIAGIYLLTHRPQKQFKISSQTQENFRIPPEELFLPQEPDFLPGVILEREPKTHWTTEDAAPFWQDPLKNGEEPWREQIEAIIDELMEGVP